jgi:hypothetical protein
VQSAQRGVFRSFLKFYKSLFQFKLFDDTSGMPSERCFRIHSVTLHISVSIRFNTSARSPNHIICCRFDFHNFPDLLQAISTCCCCAAAAASSAAAAAAAAAAGCCCCCRRRAADATLGSWISIHCHLRRILQPHLNFMPSHRVCFPSQRNGLETRL